MKNKKIVVLALAAVAAIGFSACGNEEPADIIPDIEKVVIPGGLDRNGNPLLCLVYERGVGYSNGAVFTLSCDFAGEANLSGVSLSEINS